MRLRQFTVPFAKIVGDDATELEFGPDDYLVVRPLFGLPRDEIASWWERIKAMDEDAPDGAADQLVLDMLRAVVVEWHLVGPEGPIPMPGTPAALGALPGGIAGALFAFLASYRGEGTNPTIPR